MRLTSLTLIITLLVIAGCDSTRDARKSRFNYSPFSGKSILIDSPEISVGEDLNQDGDKTDNIVRIVIIEDNSLTHNLIQPPFIIACIISLILIVAVVIRIRKR